MKHMYLDFQEYIPTCHICLHIIRHIRMRYLQSNGAVRFAQRVCRYASVNPYVRLLGINHFVFQICQIRENKLDAEVDLEVLDM